MTAMQKAFPLALAAILALAACKQETIVADDNDDMKDEIAAARPVELPPSIKSAHTYRCKDNSLVYIDLFEGDMMANVRTEKAGTPVVLRAEKAGDPLVADGYSLTGDDTAVTLTLPGKGSQGCKTG